LALSLGDKIMTDEQRKEFFLKVLADGGYPFDSITGLVYHTEQEVLDVYDAKSAEELIKEPELENKTKTK
jgi:hypothetical protein